MYYSENGSHSWRMYHENSTDCSCYEGSTDRTVLPTSRWVPRNYGPAPAPTVELADTEVLPGDSQTNPASAVDSHAAADSNSELGSLVNRMDSFTSDSGSDISYAPTRPAFLVVRNAGDDDINGRYACVGTHSDAPKYRKVGGTSILFYESGLWRLNDEENTNQRLYDGPASRTPLPTSGWTDFSGRHAPAPTVSFGSHHDLQAGDKVVIVKTDRLREVDWSGCPQSDRFSLGLTRSWTIDRIEGDWWFNTVYPQKIIPLAAVGHVKFNGQRHTISAVERTLASSASAPARAFAASTAASSSQAPPQEQQVEEEKDGGFDEEWCPDQDVEKFRCCICLLVARDAMVHECGSVLFCEMCWVKCQQDSDNCPVCREPGSSIAQSHGDRRLIRNLLITCPNKCEEKIALCEKAGFVKVTHLEWPLMQTQFDQMQYLIKQSHIEGWFKDV